MTTPRGFRFSAMAAGIKKNKPYDIGIIVSDRPCKSAALFTTNRAKAAPVLLDMEHIKARDHYAVICNSGTANAATGAVGMANARETASVLAAHLFIKPEETLVTSTGVIGQHLPMKNVKAAIPRLVDGLGKDPETFTRAIMTTDTRPKTASKRVMVGGKRVTIWGTAKGSGMLHPNMATMLSFVITDAAIPKPLLKPLLKQATDESFHRITIDGDTSTNDTLTLMANGAAENKPLKKGTPDHKKFLAALTDVCRDLAEQVVADGEGATRIAEIKVEKAKTAKEADTVARAVSESLLVKTALHGMDPNWGRIIAAAGYSGAKVDPDRMELYFGKHCAFKKGLPVPKMESKLAREMKKEKVEMRLSLNRGKASASRLFCDLGKDYVSINADYRT